MPRIPIRGKRAAPATSLHFGGNYSLRGPPISGIVTGGRSACAACCTRVGHAVRGGRAAPAAVLRARASRPPFSFTNPDTLMCARFSSVLDVSIEHACARAGLCSSPSHWGIPGLISSPPPSSDAPRCPLPGAATSLFAWSPHRSDSFAAATAVTRTATLPIRLRPSPARMVPLLCHPSGRSRPRRRLAPGASSSADPASRLAISATAWWWWTTRSSRGPLRCASASA